MPESNLEKLPKTEYCWVTFQNPKGISDPDHGSVNKIRMTWELACIYAAQKQKGSKRVLAIEPIPDKK
jgi:hypothetical protein